LVFNGIIDLGYFHPFLNDTSDTSPEMTRDVHRYSIEILDLGDTALGPLEMPCGKLWEALRIR
jgi:hypothetical protein